MRSGFVRRVLLLPVVTALLVACGAAPTATAPQPPATVAPAATVVPPMATTAPDPTVAAVVTVAPELAPTEPPAIPTAPPPTATQELTIERGRTPEGYHYLGSPDAPVTIQDFSDFF